MVGRTVKDEAMGRALAAIQGHARNAKVARSLPPGKRPPAGFMLSIGIKPEGEIVGPSDEAPMEPDEDEDEDA